MIFLCGRRQKECEMLSVSCEFPRGFSMFKTAGRLAWVVVSENAEWGRAGQGRREGQGRGANKVDGMGSVWSIRKAYDLWLWDVLSVGCCNSLSTICILYYLSSVAALNGRKRNHNSTTKKLLGFCWFWFRCSDLLDSWLLAIKVMSLCCWCRRSYSVPLVSAMFMRKLSSSQVWREKSQYSDSPLGIYLIASSFTQSHTPCVALVKGKFNLSNKSFYHSHARMQVQPFEQSLARYIYDKGGLAFPSSLASSHNWSQVRTKNDWLSHRNQHAGGYSTRFTRSTASKEIWETWRWETKFT